MRLYHEFLLPRQPPGQFNPREYVFDEKTSVPSVIRDHLLQFMLARVGPHVCTLYTLLADGARVLRRDQSSLQMPSKNFSWRCGVLNFKVVWTFTGPA